MSEKVISFGAVYRQITAVDFPHEDLEVGKEIRGSQYVENVGGSAPNFAQTCKKLGLDALFLGKIGTDDGGRFVREELARQNLPVILIEDSSQQTNWAINFDRNGKSVMATIGTANESVSAPEVEDKIVQEAESNARYLYFGGCFKLKGLLESGYIEISKKARTLGVTVCLDHGRIDKKRVTSKDIENMRKIVGVVDYYFPSRDEFLELWNESDIEQGLKKVRAQTNATIVVKDGENGVIGMNGQEIIKVSAFKVSVVNTVGAGDSFNAGFIKSQMDGKSFEESLSYGCATAATMISQDGFPTVARIEEIYSSTTS